MEKALFRLEPLFCRKHRSCSGDFGIEAYTVANQPVLKGRSRLVKSGRGEGDEEDTDKFKRNDLSHGAV